jgi:hypothetical protein
VKKDYAIDSSLNKCSFKNKNFRTNDYSEIKLFPNPNNSIFMIDFNNINKYLLNDSTLIVVPRKLYGYD